MSEALASEELLLHFIDKSLPEHGVLLFFLIRGDVDSQDGTRILRPELIQNGTQRGTDIALKEKRKSAGHAMFLLYCFPPLR